MENIQINLPDFQLSNEKCSGYDMITDTWCCEFHELNNQLESDEIELF